MTLLPAPDFTHSHMMTRKLTVIAFRGLLGLFLFACNSATAQLPNSFSVKQVQEFTNRGDYTALVELIDSEEASWKAAPKLSYFRDMSAIGEILTGSTNPKIFWLGRKAQWDALFKTTPDEYGVPHEFYFWKGSVLLSNVENITPYEDSLSPEMFALVRHDTFLMLSEYARQLHATITPGYRNKVTGAMSESADRQHYMQNAIDNQVQIQARSALSLLATDHVDYLIEAYSHHPRDDEELKTLLDILNVQGADRVKVMRGTP
jgi:hypothetical protein